VTQLIHLYLYLGEISGLFWELEVTYKTQYKASPGVQNNIGVLHVIIISFRAVHAI
jgi:hypothetical protein